MWGLIALSGLLVLGTRAMRALVMLVHLPNLQGNRHLGTFSVLYLICYRVDIRTAVLADSGAGLSLSRVFKSQYPGVFFSPDSIPQREKSLSKIFRADHHQQTGIKI